MELKYDGKKYLKINGQVYNINDIYAFDVENSGKEIGLRLIKRDEEVLIESFENIDDSVIIKSVNEQLKKLGLENFVLIDFVIINMDNIMDVSYGKGFIMVQFMNKFYTKTINKDSQKNFLKNYDKYLEEKSSIISK